MKLKLLLSKSIYVFLNPVEKYEKKKEKKFVLSLLNMFEYAQMWLNKQDSETTSSSSMPKFWVWQSSE